MGHGAEAPEEPVAEEVNDPSRARDENANGAGFLSGQWIIRFLMFRLLILSLLFSCQTFACLWDRDTLAEEIKGRPELAKLIVGWFDRYPPQYYQIRLDRVVEELPSRPSDLGLYDDAAVACDRLGRPDEAIRWMAKKKAVLDSLPANEAKDHRYRYLSNLGTFHLHRWISLPQEERESDFSDLEESERLVALAIEGNPDAHFGREIYQLMAIRWLLWDGVSPIEAPTDVDLTFDSIHWISSEANSHNSSSASVNVDGIYGLIQLGIAWESSDAFRTLASQLDAGGMASIAELAYLREKELIATGKGSLHPVAKIRNEILPGRSTYLPPECFDSVAAYFPAARAAADGRNAAWVSYQETLFAKGMHPDTHPDFWKGWSEPGFPEPPGLGLMERLLKYPYFVVGGLFTGFIILVCLGLLCIKLIRRAGGANVDSEA